MCRFLPAPSVRRAIDFSKHKRKGSSIFLSTPSARRATPWQSIHGRSTQFLSTPSARRATQAGYPSVGRRWYFYPRPPRGGRRQPSRCRVCSLYFYPRPPRGGRPAQAVRSSLTWRFLSTPSARRATGNWVARLWACSISIHALREEGDIPPCRSRRWATYFYPRPPRGGRHFFE